MSILYLRKLFPANPPSCGVCWVRAQRLEQGRSYKDAAINVYSDWALLFGGWMMYYREGQAAKIRNSRVFFFFMCVTGVASFCFFRHSRGNNLCACVWILCKHGSEHIVLANIWKQTNEGMSDLTRRGPDNGSIIPGSGQSAARLRPTPSLGFGMRGSVGEDWLRCSVATEMWKMPFFAISFNPFSEFFIQKNSLNRPCEKVKATFHSLHSVPFNQPSWIKVAVEERRLITILASAIIKPKLFLKRNNQNMSTVHKISWRVTFGPLMWPTRTLHVLSSSGPIRRLHTI